MFKVVVNWRVIVVQMQQASQHLLGYLQGCTLFPLTHVLAKYLADACHEPDLVISPGVEQWGST